MRLKIPVVVSYKPLKYQDKYGRVNIIIDEDNSKNIYVSLLRGHNHVLRTLIIKPNLEITIKHNEWYGSNGYYLSSNMFAYIEKNKLIISKGKDIVGEYKASDILKYVFNPHERIGAIIYTDNSIFSKRKKHAIIGFSDGSYNIVESSILDIIPYADGFIIAYKEDKQIVLERIPYGIESRFNIETNSLALYRYESLLAVSHDNGSLIIDGRNMDALNNVPLKYSIPLGITDNILVLWNYRSHAIHIKRHNNHKDIIALICKSRPLLAGVLEDKILLGCSNSIIEVRNSSWRLHEASKEILGDQLVSALVIGNSLVVGTPKKIIVWGTEKYSFNTTCLLGLRGLLDKYLLTIDNNGVGIVNINKYIDSNTVIVRDTLELDKNLRLKRKIEFNKKLVISSIIPNGNKVMMKKHNSFNIIFVNNKPVIFNILYYGEYKAENHTILFDYNLEVLSAKIMHYSKTDAPTDMLNVLYKYINPLNKDILEPVIVNGKKIGYIRLRRKSKGISLIQIPMDTNIYSDSVKVGNIVVPVSKRFIKYTKLYIDDILIDLIDGKLALILKILTENPINNYEQVYVCARGFFNGCKELKLVDNNYQTISVPVTVNYFKKHINLSLYKLNKQPHNTEIIKYDSKNIMVDSNTISLITTIYKNKIYSIIDNLPANNYIIVLVNGIIEKYNVRELPLLLSYRLDDFSRRKVNIAVLQLYNETLYYNRNQL